MAIPKLKKQDVIDALKFIDENGVPEHNTSVKYVLVSEDGKKYPPKYVVAVADHEDLNENYQIGASYFLKLKTLDFDQLWTDYLQPLLQEYIQGMYDEEGIMNRFARAYGYQKPARGDANEAAQDQG